MKLKIVLLSLLRCLGLYAKCKSCGITRFLMKTDEYGLCSVCHDYHRIHLKNIEDNKIEKVDTHLSTDTNRKTYEITHSKHFNIPPRTKRLLLFTQLSPDTYQWEKGEPLQIGDYILTIKTFFIKNIEPSVISSTLPIRRPLENDNVEPLPYWPRYDAMTPEQRWIYVNWLTDITKPIDIGYVFVYYYGLERHLMMGNFEDAVEEILLLQKHHHHKSFLGYSSTALVVAMYARGDFKYLNELLSNEYADDHCNPDILFLAKADKGIKLSAKELMVSARKIGFTNTRYIKAYPYLFEKYLNGLLLEYETKHQCSLLHKTEWQKSPKRRTMMFANLSLGDHRFRTIPCITKKAPFVKEVRLLLQSAHELVKSEVKIQKNGNPAPKKNEDEVAQKKALQKEKQNKEKQIREQLINEILIPYPEVLENSDASKSMSNGGKLEQKGDIVGAVKQFEISIALEFFGFYPYERLMVLYRRYKMYKDEIRVIDRTIELYKRKRFNWDISKLEARKDKALSMKDNQKNYI